MRVMVAPMKVGQQTGQGLRFVKDKAPLVSSLTEMDAGRSNRWINMAKEVFGSGYRVYSKDIGVHSQECPVIIKRRPNVSVEAFQVWPISPDVGEVGLGNDRYLAMLRFKCWRRTYVLFATHTNAGVQDVIGKPGHPPTFDIRDNQRWKVSIPAWAEIERKVGEAILDPRVSGVLLQGDFNIMPEGEGRTNPYSPHLVCQRLGMKYHNERVVWQCWWGLHPVKPFRVYPPGKGGWPSDHAAFLGTFRRSSQGFTRRVEPLPASKR